MRFKVDENLHDDVSLLLAEAGHDSHTVHNEGIRGCSDSNLAQHCLSEGRIIVTMDLDFADIRTFPPENTAGIIVLRVVDQSRNSTLNVMSRVLQLLEHEPITGRLWIVNEAGVRMRGG